MTFDPVIAVLLIPAGAAMLLAVLPGYRLTARLNVLAVLSSFVVAFRYSSIGPARDSISTSMISITSSSCSRRSWDSRRACSAPAT
jgi:hypothetical protein